MKQVLIKKDGPYIDDVPAPTPREGTVLVRVCYSCISTGTEAADVANSGESIIKKGLKRPEKVVKTIGLLKSQGVSETVEKIQRKMRETRPLGYSASGIVIESGGNMPGIEVGDRVACAGYGIANHSEYIEVPQNLLVTIPDEVDYKTAATVSLGAIAMQAVRRATPELGAYVAVIGLGIVGQILAQLLRANGCRVIGIDIDDRRVKKGLHLGLVKTVHSEKEDPVSIVNNISHGYGVDAVFITTATASSKPLNDAFHMCRKKGKVILVGVVGMEPDREAMYQKELDFLISTSYGPGRYDDAYEHRGIDYPFAYVRWTERRNMEAYLRLIADKKIDIQSLIEEVYDIEDAVKAYEDLGSSSKKPLIILLRYNQDEKQPISKKTDIGKKTVQQKDGCINIAIIGAGDFAKTIHLPNLVKLKDRYTLNAVMSRTGSNAKGTARVFGAQYATTDFQIILEDTDIDAVIIATRHHLHAQMAIKALRAGKAVFLEKPMAVTSDELDTLVKTLKETNMPFTVGFNRRFSKYALEIKRCISQRVNPMIINYQMNAGYLPKSHWINNKEEGGRIIGEACHIIDLFTYFTDSEIVSIKADKLKPSTDYYDTHDNAIIVIKYSDGSICSLTYTSLGNNQYPKELCQIYFDGKIIVIDDYKTMKGFGLKLKGESFKTPAKGQYEELEAFAQYLKGSSETPIPLWHLIQTTRATFQIHQLI